MTRIHARPLRPEDAADWRVLFDGYAEFYDVAMTDAIAARVWGWLLDPGHGLEGLIARDADDRALGIAHVRAWPRPLSGREIGFLDDLYVRPEARGRGAADALLGALARHAQRNGWEAIRWLTQEHNGRARAFYDRYTGGRSEFVMYQWSPPSADAP